MKQYIVKDDQIKLACYTLLNFTLTLLLSFAILYLFGNQYFLLAFFAMTALWFSVKYMCRYGSRYIRKQPVCVCKEQYVLFHSWTNDEKKLRYQEIKEVRLLRDWKSVKLFFAADQVDHPSGWWYVGIVYYFKRGELDEIEQTLLALFNKHHVKISKTEKQKKRVS